jgi:hypothetical protein
VLSTSPVQEGSYPLEVILDPQGVLLIKCQNDCPPKDNL